MPQSERVLVIGATQGTGSEIVWLLLHDGYRVRVLARDEAKAKEKFGNQKFGGAVEIVAGDITKPSTLPAAMSGVDHIILTAGVTKRPAGEQLIKTTVYDGTVNTLTAARQAGFNGRFLYMSVIGTTKPSWLGFLLNLAKRNTLYWRRRAEAAIRQSGFDYTIIHAGILTDDPAGQRTIEISQNQYPMALKYKISRADVAEIFVQALRYSSTRNTSFDAVWATGDAIGDSGAAPGQEASRPWDVLFARLSRDT